MVDKVIPEEVCTTREAAALLDVSLRTVQLWVESGVLDAWKTPGGHRRVSVKSIQEVIASRQFEHLHPISTSNDTINVLIVEDEMILRRLYELTIEKWSIETSIVAVQDGFEALVEIGKRKPDLIITDINMQGMDGITLLRKLRESSIYDDVEIIVVTGLDAEKLDEMGGVPDGVTVFIKPAPFALIQSCIQNVANKKLAKIYNSN
ncbi:MAG: response regulator [Gallionella sp.]|nr:response regulator [Gallionella sp.]